MKWKRSNPEPSPEHLAAWANGELDRLDAERVERWLVAHPNAASEAEAACRLVPLYRDHPPPEPSDQAWQAVLGRIDAGLHAPAPSSRTPGPRWRLRLFLGLAATAAAVLGGVALARAFWPAPVALPDNQEIVERPTPPPVPNEPDEPFEVVPLSEVNIISINAEDADRLMVGQSLMGAFDLAALEDIEIVKMEPHSEDGQMPRLRRGTEAPMIVVASAGNPEP